MRKIGTVFILLYFICNLSSCPNIQNPTEENTNGEQSLTATVRFNSMGASTIEPITVLKGERIPTFPFPRNEENDDLDDDLVFTGWYTTKNGNGTANRFEHTDIITKNLMLYATWKIPNLPDNYYQYDSATDSYIITDENILYGEDVRGDVVIANTFNGKKVTCITDGSFYFSEATSIAVPQNIEILRGHAFSSLDNATHITLSEGLNAEMDDVWGSTFSSMLKLERISLPNSLTNILRGSFASNKALKSIIIPKNVTAIGESAFQACSSLTEVSFGNKIALFDKYAFKNCSSLKNVTLPSSLSSIGWESFMGCINLESLTISTKVGTIWWDAFEGCTNLTLYAERTSAPAWTFSGRTGWAASQYGSWNEEGRPIVWGCVLDEQKQYVVSIKKTAKTISYSPELSAPYREKHTFAGWSINQESTIADEGFETANSLRDVPVGQTVYAVWVK